VLSSISRRGRRDHKIPARMHKKQRRRKEEEGDGVLTCPELKKRPEEIIMKQKWMRMLSWEGGRVLEHTEDV